MRPVFCDVIALKHKQTSNMASEELEVSTSQLKVKKHDGQFCLAEGPNGIRCTNSTYSHGISMHTLTGCRPSSFAYTGHILGQAKSFLCSENCESNCFVNRYGNFKKSWNVEVFLLYLQSHHVRKRVKPSHYLDVKDDW